MKAILEFNLPEESDNFETASNATKYRAILSDLYGWLRSKTKYEDIESIEVEQVKKKMIELLTDYNLSDF